MGYKIAGECLRRGHVVTLISGPVNLTSPRVKRFISIDTADALFKALKKELPKADCLIMCAAVSDFRMKGAFKKKIKRSKRLTLRLFANRDILSALSKYEKDKLFVGFSLETGDWIGNACRKLKNKKLDLIVANRLTKRHNAFGDNRLDVAMLDRSGSVRHIKAKNKAFIAHVLLDKIEELWYLKR